LRSTSALAQRISFRHFRRFSAANMEVSLVARGTVPEDAVLSVRAGTIRRQAAVGSGRSFRFPKSAIKENPLKVDILQQIGSAYLVLKPGEDQYKLKFNNEGLNCEVGVKTLADGEEASPDPEAKKSDSTAGSAKEAKDYLETHQVLQFVQAVLQTVIKDKPADPWSYIANHFLSGYEPNESRTTTDKPPAKPVDVPVEEPKKEAPKEEPKAEVPKEEPKAEVPKEEPKPEVPQEEPKEEAPPALQMAVTFPGHLNELTEEQKAEFKAQALKKLLAEMGLTEADVEGVELEEGSIIVKLKFKQAVAPEVVQQQVERVEAAPISIEVAGAPAFTSAGAMKIEAPKPSPPHQRKRHQRRSRILKLCEQKLHLPCLVLQQMDDLKVRLPRLKQTPRTAMPMPSNL